MARRSNLDWERVRPGVYKATGDDGSQWRIVQATSRRWEVYRDGAAVATWPHTLAEAKWLAEREQQPPASQATTP